MSDQPWYKNCEPEIAKANAICKSHRGATFDLQVENEIANYFLETVVRTIFESNRVEGAGLGEGETRKIIQNEGQTIWVIKSLPPGKVIPADPRRNYQLSYKDKDRGYLEVMLHLNAIQLATEFHREDIRDNNKAVFNEERIKQIHLVLMNGLIGEEWDIDSGKYRNAPCHTGFEYLHTDCRNIPHAMKEWVFRANNMMTSVDDPISKAAKISYEFVAIHPFPDGNGRMSRIILNMVLASEGLPFMAVLKGNKQGKKKYMNSLRLANEGKYDRYACLIAKSVNSQWEEMNRRLELAGFKPIPDPA